MHSGASSPPLTLSAAVKTTFAPTSASSAVGAAAHPFASGSSNSSSSSLTSPTTAVVPSSCPVSPASSPPSDDALSVSPPAQPPRHALQHQPETRNALDFLASVALGLSKDPPSSSSSSSSSSSKAVKAPKVKKEGGKATVKSSAPSQLPASVAPSTSSKSSPSAVLSPSPALPSSTLPSDAASASISKVKGSTAPVYLSSPEVALAAVAPSAPAALIPPPAPAPAPALASALKSTPKQETADVRRKRKAPKDEGDKVVAATASIPSSAARTEPTKKNTESLKRPTAGKVPPFLLPELAIAPAPAFAPTSLPLLPPQPPPLAPPPPPGLSFPPATAPSSSAAPPSPANPSPLFYHLPTSSASFPPMYMPMHMMVAASPSGSGSSSVSVAAATAPMDSFGSAPLAHPVPRSSLAVAARASWDAEEREAYSRALGHRAAALPPAQHQAEYAHLHQLYKPQSQPQPHTGDLAAMQARAQPPSAPLSLEQQHFLEQFQHHLLQQQEQQKQQEQLLQEELQLQQEQQHFQQEQRKQQQCYQLLDAFRQHQQQQRLSSSVVSFASAVSASDAHSRFVPPAFTAPGQPLPLSSPRLSHAPKLAPVHSSAQAHTSFPSSSSLPVLPPQAALQLLQLLQEQQQQRQQQQEQEQQEQQRQEQQEQLEQQLQQRVRMNLAVSSSAALQHSYAPSSLASPSFGTFAPTATGYFMSAPPAPCASFGASSNPAVYAVYMQPPQQPNAPPSLHALRGSAPPPASAAPPPLSFPPSFPPSALPPSAHSSLVVPYSQLQYPSYLPPPSALPSSSSFSSAEAGVPFLYSAPAPLAQTPALSRPMFFAPAAAPSGAFIRAAAHPDHSQPADSFTLQFQGLAHTVSSLPPPPSFPPPPTSVIQPSCSPYQSTHSYFPSSLALAHASATFPSPALPTQPPSVSSSCATSSPRKRHALALTCSAPAALSQVDAFRYGPGM